MNRRAGYILVGGQSSRMGTDKALLPFRGRTLAEAIAAALEPVTGRPILVGSSACAHLGFQILPDLYPGEGPLGGVLTALRNSSANRTLVTACDMPEITADFLESLMEVAEASDAGVLVPEGPGGKLEPLCAIYGPEAHLGLSAAFERGVRKLSTAFEEIGLKTVQTPEVLHFQNVNTPQDWAPYAG